MNSGGDVVQLSNGLTVGGVVLSAHPVEQASDDGSEGKADGAVQFRDHEILASRYSTRWWKRIISFLMASIWGWMAMAAGSRSGMSPEDGSNIPARIIRATSGPGQVVGFRSLWPTILLACGWKDRTTAT